MSYTKTNWQDLPNTTTPVTAANLNNMENGIKRSDSAVGGIDYDSTATYDKGEYCIYESVLYVANQNIDTPEAFNSAHWDATAVINELETLRKSGGIPTNSIIGYDGSTIPSGFEETDGPNDYSTSEKVVGKWIDGKPLYRRVYTGTTPNATSGIIGNVPNIEQAVKILGLYNMAGYWTNFEGGISSLNVLVQIQVSTGDLYYSAPSDARNKPYILIIEYTKTTD